MSPRVWSPRGFGSGPAVRIAGVFAVFVLALAAFLSGVTTSGVPELAGQSLLAWTYYAGGLFVFGGLDLGIPVGGPGPGRAALWFAYFLAPTITTTTAIDAALRMIRPQRGGATALEGHVVLVGAGQVGLAYLQAIREVEPMKPVLLVNRESGSANTAEAERLGEVEVMSADIQRPAALDMLGLERADRMIVVTDDDLVNLEGAWAANDRVPELPIAVHVADLTLLRPVNRMIRAQAGSRAGAAGPPLVFNTHRIGALHLYEQHLHAHFEETGYKDVLVIGGFGRFAQTILELLRVTAPDELERVVVVDAAASRMMRQFEADVPLDALNHIAIDGELEDPGTWANVDAALASVEADPVYLLASSNEVVNFRAAMLLRGRSDQTRIFARCFHRSRFAESLAGQGAFELLAFEDVLRNALTEHYEGLKTL